MGFPPISTIGFGFSEVSSERREPRPPARISTFILYELQLGTDFTNLYELHERGTDYESR